MVRVMQQKLGMELAHLSLLLGEVCVYGGRGGLKRRLCWEDRVGLTLEKSQIPGPGMDFMHQEPAIAELGISIVLGVSRAGGGGDHVNYSRLELSYYCSLFTGHPVKHLTFSSCKHLLCKCSLIPNTCDSCFSLTINPDKSCPHSLDFNPSNTNHTALNCSVLTRQEQK